MNEHVLRIVLNYCQEHLGDAATAPDDDADSRKKNTDISSVDIGILSKLDQEALFEVILVIPSLYLLSLTICKMLNDCKAANYLDVKGLLDVGCKWVANMIKGKSPEDIRSTFNIRNDFTPEEEEQIRRENEWAEE